MMASAGFFRLLPDLPKVFWRYPVSYVNYMSWALQASLINYFLASSLRFLIFSSPCKFTCFCICTYFLKIMVGGIQERHVRTGIRCHESRRPKADRRSNHHGGSWVISELLQVVGFRSSDSHSHRLQIGILHGSQAEGESIAICALSSHQDHSAPYQQKAVIQENTIFFFVEETSHSHLIVFPRRS